MKFIYSLFVGLALFSLPMTATALTFKKGQVLGPDGQVYDGASPQLRARMADWLKRADDRYLPALGAVTYGLFRRKQILTKSPEELEAYYLDIPDPDRRAQRRSVVENGVDAPIVEGAILALDRMLADMETALGAHAYLVDGGYGLADAALTPFVSRLHELAMDWMWDDRPHVAAWWDTVRDRDSFGTVFDAFPDPRRKAGLRAAGEETREAAERILSGSPCR